MKALLVFALLAGALLVLGCTGSQPAGPNVTENATAPGAAGMDQFIKNETAPVVPGMPALNNSGPAMPSGDNGPQAAPAAPQPGPSMSGQPMVLNPQNALKISMLRKGDTVSFGRSMLRLENIYYKSGPMAQYTLSDQDGNNAQKLELGQNQSYQFTGPDKTEYAVRAIFIVGQGMPSGVQTQIYSAASAGASNTSAKLGRPENAYTIAYQYPPAVALANRTLSVGARVASADGIGAELAGIDKTGKPASADLRVLDAQGAEIGTVNLQNGQMVLVTMDAQNRFDVVLQSLDTAGAQASVQIWRVMAFANATYGMGKEMNSN
ncbi:Uncharacterised protein [uncultured archaeon]|nr:Uncharacterised protein [uncultured archaeon]